MAPLKLVLSQSLVDLLPRYIFSKEYREHVSFISAVNSKCIANKKQARQGVKIAILYVPFLFFPRFN